LVTLLIYIKQTFYQDYKTPYGEDTSIHKME
jgi:hypothetical protein